MSKLDNLLWPWRGDVGFLDDMRRGHFDAEKGKLVLDAIQELVDKIAKSDIEEKYEIANLCEVFYYVSDVERLNNTKSFTDYDLETFDSEIHGIVDRLYPDDMML